jgi:hypothetical protein
MTAPNNESIIELLFFAKLCCLTSTIFLSGLTVWRVYESALPAIQDVKVLRATNPLVVEFYDDDPFLKGNETSFDNHLVHLVGHLYTLDELNECNDGK